jgi:ABC-type branched-subunit amino acid transport system substrate-binding protein
MKKRCLLIGLLALVLAVALVAVACGGEEATTTTEQVTTTVVYPQGSSTGPIKVGHIFDDTGVEAVVGSLVKVAIQYTLGSATVAGRPIELFEADSKSTAEGAVEAARKLVEQDQVDVILGPTQIGQKNAVATYCAEKQVPMVLYNPTPSGPLEENEWVVGVGGSPGQFGTCIADYMYNVLGYRTISTLGPDDTSGHAFFDPVTDYFTVLGGQVVQQQWATVPTDDWSAYLTTVQDADALVAWVGGQGIPLLTQYYDTGLYKRMPIVGAFQGFMDPWVPRNIGETNQAAAENLLGAVCPLAWDPDSQNPANLAFIEGMTPLKPWGKPADDGLAGPAQTGQVLLAALESCATNLSNLSLRDALLATSITGPEGPVFFAPGENIATKNIYIVEVALIPAAEHPDDPRLLFEYHTVKTYEAVPPQGLEQ